MLLLTCSQLKGVRRVKLDPPFSKEYRWAGMHIADGLISAGRLVARFDLDERIEEPGQSRRGTSKLGRPTGQAA